MMAAASPATAPMATPAIRRNMPMLLLESDALLRRTVVLTARSLGMSEIQETGNQAMARRMLGERAFCGALIALDFGERRYYQYDLTVIDQIRDGRTASGADMPIAVLLGHCDAPLLRELRLRGVSKVILKPFRVRALLDVFTDIQQPGAG